MDGQEVTSVEELITKVKKDYADWKTQDSPWFRGEPADSKEPLLPKLYRATPDGRKHDEGRLLQNFRVKAPSFGTQHVLPSRGTDELLFLAQHVGLPTRLLDWTEGLLTALYFALLEKQPAIWMLDSLELNRQATGLHQLKDFSLTWFSADQTTVKRADIRLLAEDMIQAHGKGVDVVTYVGDRSARRWPVNIGILNIRGAWENNAVGLDLPIAVRAIGSHPRMIAQKSCFTVQGKKKDSLSNLVGSKVLRKYVIRLDKISEFKTDLRMMGITATSVFPDLDSLAKDLAEVF